MHQIRERTDNELGTLVYFVNSDDDSLTEFKYTGFEREFNIQFVYDSAAAARAKCVIMDFSGDCSVMLKALEQIRASEQPPPVIILADASDIRTTVQAMRAGAFDVLQKPVDGAQLESSVSEALGAIRCYGPAVPRDVARARLTALTDRERQILNLITRGHPNKNIAADLQISQRTVENHRASIMKKTSTRTLSGLIQVVIAAS